MDYIFALSALSWPFYLRVEQDENFHLLILNKLGNLATKHEYSLLCYGIDKICSNRTPTIQNLRGTKGMKTFSQGASFIHSSQYPWALLSREEKEPQRALAYHSCSPGLRHFLSEISFLFRKVFL